MMSTRAPKQQVRIHWPTDSDHSPVLLANMRPPSNRAAGGITAPGSHNTGHAGPRPAVPGGPCGI
jgi:hypothetical protein